MKIKRAGILPTIVILTMAGGGGGEGGRRRGAKRVESSPNLVGCLCVILFDAFLWAWFQLTSLYRGNASGNLSRVLRGSGIYVYYSVPKNMRTYVMNISEVQSTTVRIDGPAAECVPRLRFCAVR